jgi:hypothetical protein
MRVAVATQPLRPRDRRHQQPRTWNSHTHGHTATRLHARRHRRPETHGRAGGETQAQAHAGAHGASFGPAGALTRAREGWGRDGARERGRAIRGKESERERRKESERERGKDSEGKTASESEVPPVLARRQRGPRADTRPNTSGDWRRLSLSLSHSVTQSRARARARTAPAGPEGGHQVQGLREGPQRPVPVRVLSAWTRPSYYYIILYYIILYYIILYHIILYIVRRQ